MMISKLSFVALVLLIADVRCINFYLEPNGRKCLRDEVQADVQVTGDYSVSEVLGQRVDYAVKDNDGHILSQKDDIPPGKNGKFSFIAETFTVFEICFVSKVQGQHPGQKQAINLILKSGIETKSYEGIGEAAKLKPIEVELRKLEDLSEAIVRDFATMRANEKQLRDSNEVTNSRVLYFSIFSMCCLLGLATWQVFYLRRFFRAKKLIE